MPDRYTAREREDGRFEVRDLLGYDEPVIGVYDEAEAGRERDRLNGERRPCAFCGEPTSGAWVELRLYDGPGLKIGELEVAVCGRHLTAMRPAYERDLVECRVTRWEHGPA